MLFWIATAGLGLGIVIILGRAIMRGRVGALPPAAYDLRVYRDQLEEVERDLQRGVLTEAEATRIRNEVSRRILEADTQLREHGESGGQPRLAGLAVTGLAALAIVGGGFALYSAVGAPGYGDLPLAKRIALSDDARANRLSQADAEARATEDLPDTPDMSNVPAEFEELMEKLRAAVEQRPDDAQGLRLLARNEARLGNMAAAREAQKRLIEVKGAEATAQDHAYYAELMISAASGYVSKEAEAALRAALERDPRHPASRYYLGLYMLQVDRPDSTFRLWERLLAESRPDAPWVEPIRAQIEDVAWRAGVDYTLPQADDSPGPTGADIDAAEEMSPEERQEMVRGMVNRLSERLANEGGTPDEWARLIAAHGVLGDTDQARAIWEEAQQVFDGNDDAMERLRGAARQAGVTE